MLTDQILKNERNDLTTGCAKHKMHLLVADKVSIDGKIIKSRPKKIYLDFNAIAKGSELM
jgi:thiamine biosynthesis lipoprotein ApbE